MVRIASTDHPGVVCLQELPVWSLDKLDEWSSMTAVGAVARRPTLGPLPSTAEIGRVITALNPGLFRSAFTGQANAILVGPQLQVVDRREVVLNPWRFRRAQARRLGLGLLARLAWSKERRICQVARIADGERTFVVGNLHATKYTPDRRVPDAEVLRAAVFVDGVARPDEPVLLCGDFNISVSISRTLADLMSDEWGFRGATATGVDHVLVRGFQAGDPERWPRERRLLEGALLSDHAPVEVHVT